MATERPKLQIPLTTSDKVVEGLCWIGLLALWVAAFLLYNQLPAIIPIHFNGAGQADGFGPKHTLWFLPGITTVLTVGLTFLSRFPHTFNYLEEITPDNAARSYRTGIRIVRFSKLFVVILFGTIFMVVTRAAAQENPAESSFWLVPVVIAVSLLWPVAVVLYSIFQNRKKTTLNA